MIKVSMKKPKIPDDLRKHIDSLPSEVKDMIVSVILAGYIRTASVDFDVDLFIPDAAVWYVEQIKKYGYEIEYED